MVSYTRMLNKKLKISRLVQNDLNDLKTLMATKQLSEFSYFSIFHLYEQLEHVCMCVRARDLSAQH